MLYAMLKCLLAKWIQLLTKMVTKMPPPRFYQNDLQNGPGFLNDPKMAFQMLTMAFQMLTMAFEMAFTMKLKKTHAFSDYVFHDF